MSTQGNTPDVPMGGLPDGIKEQAVSAAENQLSQKLSEKLDNPVVNKIIENKDTVKKVIKSTFPEDTPMGTDAMSNGRTNHPDDIAKYFSRKTFKDFLAEKDSPIVYCTLTIDGKDFLAKNSYVVQLSQHTNEHDTFTITTPDDALDSFEGYVLENSMRLLGKTVSINLHRFGEIRQTFSGIISNIKNKKDEGGGYGKLNITGYAPSILLENGKDCQSYTDKTLAQIIAGATEEGSKEGKVQVINPNTKFEIPYTVQYKESDYQFIKRLATRYGEYFFYDGEQLIFGDKVQPTIKLEENKDLIDIELEMMIKPQSFKYMSYDSISAEIKEKDSDSVDAQYKKNPFQNMAINASKEVFKKKPDMLYNATSHQLVERDLEEMMKRQKESRQHVMQVRGRSRDPRVRMGTLAEISDINGKAMETYRIIEIFHYHNGNEYYNEFVGIPDVFISPFFDEDAYPTCEEQSAIVTDNDHPQGMIKVQFPWQKKKGLKTPWLRVVTPYAGKGKGMHIIPEVGEEVIVGFDNGNAERPFVFGAMFNGKSSAGLGGAGNFMKGLQTPAGSRLHMNDKDGSLHMQDNGGVSMRFDGGGNSTHNAATTHTTDVGGESVLQMDKSGNVSLTASTEFKISVGASTIVIKKDGTITINGKAISIDGTESFAASGKSSLKLGSKTTDIAGSTEVNIGGAKVKINT